MPHRPCRQRVCCAPLRRKQNSFVDFDLVTTLKKCSWLARTSITLPCFSPRHSQKQAVPYTMGAPSEHHLLASLQASSQTTKSKISLIRLAALAFTAHAFSESAIWPLPHRRRLSVSRWRHTAKQVEGRIRPRPQHDLLCCNLDALLVLACTILITLSPLAATPVVGQVYNKQNISVEYHRTVQQGGGIGVRSYQENPPSTLRENAASLYSSSYYSLSAEETSEYREWF